MLLEATLLVVADQEQPQGGKTKAKSNKTKGSKPKIRRTIRVRDSEPLPEPAGTSEPPSPIVSVNNVGGANSLDMSSNSPAETNPQPAEKADEEQQMEPRSGDDQLEEPTGESLDLISGSGNSQTTLMDGVGNSKVLKISNSGNSEHVEIDGAPGGSQAGKKACGHPSHQQHHGPSIHNELDPRSPLVLINIKQSAEPIPPRQAPVAFPVDGQVSGIPLPLMFRQPFAPMGAPVPMPMSAPVPMSMAPPMPVPMPMGAPMVGGQMPFGSVAQFVMAPPMPLGQPMMFFSPQMPMMVPQFMMPAPPKPQKFFRPAPIPIPVPEPSPAKDSAREQSGPSAVDAKDKDEPKEEEEEPEKEEQEEEKPKESVLRGWLPNPFKKEKEEAPKEKEVEWTTIRVPKSEAHLMKMSTK